MGSEHRSVTSRPAIWPVGPGGELAAMRVVALSSDGDEHDRDSREAPSEELHPADVFA